MKTYKEKLQYQSAKLEGLGHAGAFSVIYADGVFSLFYPVPALYGGYIALATSTDGCRWGIVKKIITGVNADSCTAIRKNGKTYLYYSERGALRLAVGGRDGVYQKYPDALCTSYSLRGLRLTVADGKKYIFTDGKRGRINFYALNEYDNLEKRKLTVSGIDGKILSPNFYGAGKKTRLIYSDGKTVREAEGTLDLQNGTYIADRVVKAYVADSVRTAFVSDGKFRLFERYGDTLSSIEATVSSDGVVYRSEIERANSVVADGNVDYALCIHTAVLPDVKGYSAYRFRIYAENGKTGVRLRFPSGNESYINYDYINNVVTVKGISGTGKPVLHSFELKEGATEFYIELTDVVRYVSADGRFTCAFRMGDATGASISVYSDSDVRFDAEVYKLKEQR